MSTRFFLFRKNDLTSHRTSRSRSRGGEIDLDLGCSHTSKEVAVVGSDNTFTVSQDTARASAAEAAGRVGDHSACLGQSLEDSEIRRLFVDLAACRCHNQFYIVSNFFALEDFRCCCEILQTAICTGTDEYLIDLCALKLADIADLVDLGRTCHNRNEVLGVVFHHAAVICVCVAEKTLLVVV